MRQNRVLSRDILLTVDCLLSDNKAFTIMEVMVVVIIVSTMAAFAIPQYTKTIERSYEQDEVMQLKTIYSADKIYFARTTAYWPPDNNNGAGYTVAQINTNLGLNIIENGVIYLCAGDGAAFDCCAYRPDNTAPDFTLKVNELGVDPCCDAGTCPTVTDCAVTGECL